MITKIDQALADQVVNTVKDVCGQDINFINRSGIIFASTNPARVGTYHEIGQKAAQTGTTIEVISDNSFYGTYRGINLPIYHNHVLLAVIGITGDPEHVRKYAHLAERITNLLIKERELGTSSRNQAEKRHFVIDSLIRKDTPNMEYVNECLKEFHVNMKTPKRLILIKINTRYNLTNLSLLEQKVTQMFSMIPLPLHTFRYPDEFLAVIDHDIFEKSSYILKHFCEEYAMLLKLTVGKSSLIYQLEESYQSAMTAWNHIKRGPESYFVYDNLTLELILSKITPQEKQEFLTRTIAALTEEEQKLLQTYFQENMSLLHTGEALYLHKNTLQYKLNRIYKSTGLNPRSFQDAVLLYLALQLLE